ncbi:ABC transporter permease [Aquimarina sp. 2201CG1-2-11]|uniref:ABC transporter permease n=1 Tax=Aquimarina discodermiae TaxID=3231043 RepID=UPI0034629E1A
MFDRDRWREIFEAISKNKLRTFLSGFTVALGILIFTILFGFGNGLKNTFQEFFVDDATNTIWLFPGRTSKPYKGFAINRVVEFRNDDIEDIKKDFALYVDYITPRISRSGLTKYKGESNTYVTRAVGPAHLLCEKTIIMKGRYVNDNDIKEKSKSVVIGRLVEQDLFGKKENAIGKFIEIDGITYKVIGVFQDDGGDNEERYIYMPYTTRQLVEKNTDKIDQIIVGFKLGIGYSGAKALEISLDKYMRDKHVIHPEDQNGLFIRNVAENVKQTLQFANILQIVVAFVGIGTLLAGIIGISNIMVFVVKERTKELGIRKALGASPKSIVSMILQESVFITTIAGIIGLFIGMTILKFTGTSLKDYFITNPYVEIGTVIGATIVLIFFGALAGYIPARRAARIKPIVALRDE